MKALIKKAEMIGGHWSDPLLYPVSVRDREEMRVESVYGNILPAATEFAGGVIGTAIGAAKFKPWSNGETRAETAALMSGVAGAGIIGAKVMGTASSPIFDYIRRKKIQDIRRRKGEPIIDENDINMYRAGKAPVAIQRGAGLRAVESTLDSSKQRARDFTIG